MAKLHDRSPVHLQVASYLRSVGLSAPADREKFTRWIQSNATARAVLTREWPEAAKAVGIDAQVPDSLLALVAEAPTEATAQLGRRALDASGMTPEALEQALEPFPGVQEVVRRSIEAWQEGIAGKPAREALAERQAALDERNGAYQQQLRELPNPIAGTAQRAKEADRRRLLHLAMQHRDQLEALAK